MPRRVDSHANETIKRLRSLRDKKGRREHGLFLAEGLRIVAEAADAGRLPRTLVYAGEAAGHPLLGRLIGQTETAGGEAIETSAAILGRVAEKDNPQAVLGAYPIWNTGLDRLDLGAAPLWLAVEGLKDPGNLGTMLRTCDAVGAGGLVLLDQSCDPFSVEAVRASMGALFTVPVAQVPWAAFLAWAREGGAMIVGTSLRAATDYQAVRYAPPTVVLMGNEQSGLPMAYEDACDQLVRLPMRGRADSLNVAVAAAVTLYEVANQFRAGA